MKSTTTLEGTWEQAKTHEAQLKGKWVSVTIQPAHPKSATTKTSTNPVRELKALGLLADMPEGSIEFASRKAAEKSLE